VITIDYITMGQQNLETSLTDIKWDEISKDNSIVTNISSRLLSFVRRSRCANAKMSTAEGEGLEDNSVINDSSN
jgi:hypothetical protein